MLLFAEFMVHLFQVLVVGLALTAVFWVIPSMVLMLRDEVQEQWQGTTGRHRQGTPGLNNFATILVLENPGGSLGTHRKSFHGRSFLQHG